MSVKHPEQQSAGHLCNKADACLQFAISQRYVMGENFDKSSGATPHGLNRLLSTPHAP